jgi:molecular chaperone DnaK (HSP70)
MTDAIPAALAILGQDGNFQVLLKAGARVPGQARAVFATQKAGQRELGFKLYEGEGGPAKAKLIGKVDVELPPGLPPNTWMNVFIAVDDALGLRIEVKENLRRINIRADVDRDGAEAAHFK